MKMVDAAVPNASVKSEDSTSYAMVQFDAERVDSPEIDNKIIMQMVENAAANTSMDSDNSAGCTIAQFEVETLLRSEPSRATIEAPDYKRKRSECWKKFGFPRVDGILHTNIVACIHCKAVYKYSSSKGTSHLNKHVCHNHRDSKPRTTPKQESKIGIRKSSRLAFGEMQVLESDVLDACILDGVPTKGYLTSGTKLLLQAAARYGAKYGANLDLEELTEAMEQRTRDGTERRHGIVQEEIINALNGDPFCATTDVWIESLSGKIYKSVTIHYISPEWVMRSFIWLTKELDLTGVVKCDPASTLPDAPFRLVAMDDIHSTTGLFHDRELENCVERTHNLSSSVISACLEPEESSEAKATVENAQFVYDHIRMHNLLLKQKVKKHSGHSDNIRDFSHADTARFLLDNWDEIKVALEGLDEMEYFKAIDKTTLSQLARVLKPLYDCAIELETDTRPTMHRVRYWEAKLNFAFAKNRCDTPAVTKMKELGRKALQTHLYNKLGIYYDIATVLDPRVGELEDRSKMIQVYGKVEYIYEKIRGNSKRRNANEARMIEGPPTKKGRKNSASPDADDIELDFYKEKRPLSSVTEELQMFTRSSFNVKHYTDEASTFDITQFWKDHARSFPKLAEVARLILACPSSGAPAKQYFPQGGWVINVRRAKFHPEDMDAMLCIRSYLKGGAWKALDMSYDGDDCIQMRVNLPLST